MSSAGIETWHALEEQRQALYDQLIELEDSEDEEKQAKAEEINNQPIAEEEPENSLWQSIKEFVVPECESCHLFRIQILLLILIIF